MDKFLGVVSWAIGMLSSDAFPGTLSLESEVFNTVQSICRGKLKICSMCVEMLFFKKARNMHVKIEFFVDVIGLASM